MPLTADQTGIALAIDAAMAKLTKASKTDAEILGAMADHMPGFKALLDAGVVNQAADRYPGFRRFAEILELFAKAIRDGAIKVPK